MPAIHSQSAIFFSYAWGGEKETYALALYESLQKAGYTVVMDRHTVAYRESFTTFMQRIGRGAFVIVVVSDKYLRSPYCMFELLELYHKSSSEMGEMAAKIYPVVMPDAKIYTDAEILDYTKYWRQKTNNLQAGMVDPELLLTDTADMAGNLKKYNEITQQLVQFANWLRDSNTATPEALAADDFAVIKRAIDDNIANQPAAENTTTQSDTGIIVNNEGAKIGQQNINSTVHNTGNNFNL